MNSNWSIDELQDIWHLATRLHSGQKYGGENEGEQIEYLNHIGGVVFELLAAIPHSPDINADFALKCAVLHDALEDTPYSYEEVEKLFGQQVADGVMALTKSETLESKESKMKDSLQRIRQQPKEVWAVKLADRIVNLYRPPYYWKNNKKQAYLEEARMILEELKEGNAYLAARLAEKIERYKTFIV